MSDKIKLKDVCKILNGFVFKSGKYVDSGIRIIRIANVQKGYIEDEKPAFYPDSEESSIRDYMLEENDLLLSLTGNVGRVALLDKKWLPAALNQRVACFRIKDNRIIKEYLYFALLSDKFENDCIKSSKGIAQKNMSTEWIKGYEIPLPSEQKQREIVSSLEQLSMIIKNKTEQIQQLDNLIKARFVEMFGEKDATSKVLIGDAVELINGRALKPTDWTPTGLPIIRIQNLNDTKAPYNYFYGAYDKKNYIKSGELLFSWSGTPGTSFGAFIWNRGPGLLNQHIFRVLPKKDYDLNFLRFALNAQLDEIISKAHGGVGLQHITKSELEKIAIPYPNRKLQAAFSAFVAQIDKSKFALQNSIKSLMNLWYNINNMFCERTYGEA